MSEKKKSKSLGLSIILASVILAGAIIYGFDTLSKILISSNQPAPEPDRLAIQETDHVKGERDALVTIVEFSDLEDPFSKEMYSNLKKLTQEYGDKVAWAYRHFPVVSLHPHAKKAAIAAECAYNQGKFWQYTDRLFEMQDTLTKDVYADIANDLNFNEINFKECLKSEKVNAKVRNDFKQGLELGVTGTPATFINKKSMLGAVSYSTLKAKVEEIISKKVSQEQD